MDEFIRGYCKYFNMPFDGTIRQYNLNKMTVIHSINCIINYKIENNKDIIYKEDIPKIFSKFYKLYTSQEKFMENVMKKIKHYDLDINNLTIENIIYSSCLQFYYISTFLEHESVDIKIALKD